MLPTLDRIRARFSRRLVFKLSRPGSVPCRMGPAARPPGEDAPRRPRVGDDAIVYRMAERIALGPDQLRELRAKLPPSTISYDDEGDMVY